MGKVIDLNYKTAPSLYNKIMASFILMALITCGIFGAIIYFAENKMEVISLHHWLDSEARRYTSDYQLYGDKASPPNQHEFLTYWSEKHIPDWLHEYTNRGFYEVMIKEEDKHFIVRHHPSGNGLMYIVFKADADDYLDAYEHELHRQTLMIGSLVLGFMISYGAYMVRSLSRPLNRIQSKINQMAPNQPPFQVDSEYLETRLIEQTLLDSKIRIDDFFNREQEFSRFASHELRTPIMIIGGSADLLAKIPDQSPIMTRAIKRIQSANEQMTLLTETFLFLGKELIDSELCMENNLKDALISQIDDIVSIIPSQRPTYQLKIDSNEMVHAPSCFVTIVINNLISNAFSYGSGSIDIVLSNSQLVISNTYYVEPHSVGYGYGLVIIKRICERMNWCFEYQDTKVLFKASLTFK